MTQEEKKRLHRAQFGIEQILALFHCDVRTTETMKEPSLTQLEEMVDCLRVFVKYALLDLEATWREKKALEKALRDIQ